MKLEEYKANIDKMNAEQAKLDSLRAQIKEISFSKGKRDTAKLTLIVKSPFVVFVFRGSFAFRDSIISYCPPSQEVLRNLFLRFV